MSDSTRKRRSRKDANRPRKANKIHYLGRWTERVNDKFVGLDGDVTPRAGRFAELRA
jgi:hypothetical protein